MNHLSGAHILVIDATAENASLHPSPLCRLLLKLRPPAAGGQLN